MLGRVLLVVSAAAALGGYGAKSAALSVDPERNSRERAQKAVAYASSNANVDYYEPQASLDNRDTAFLQGLTDLFTKLYANDNGYDAKQNRYGGNLNTYDNHNAYDDNYDKHKNVYENEPIQPETPSYKSRVSSYDPDVYYVAALGHKPEGPGGTPSRARGNGANAHARGQARQHGRGNAEAWSYAITFGNAGGAEANGYARTI